MSERRTTTLLLSALSLRSCFIIVTREVHNELIIDEFSMKNLIGSQLSEHFFTQGVNITIRV